jgi:hypothetical protein
MASGRPARTEGLRRSVNARETSAFSDFGSVEYETTDLKHLSPDQPDSGIAPFLAGTSWSQHSIEDCRVGGGRRRAR